ncbi:MAG TPA: cytochrome c [Thermoanaerobaculia bacterium]|nr:cytochrome c [Thermoanaerobaculia bacterium]
MSRGERTLGASSLVYLAALVLVLTGCRQKMADQPSYDPLEPSAFFEDGMSSRPVIEGTVARGQLRLDTHFEKGKIGEQLATRFPATVELNLATMQRGRKRYDIYCSPCHGRSGDGNGMIVQRGYRRPAAFTSERVMEATVGHYFDVITNGFGAMPPYAVQIPPADRWAIVAYVKALQLSQNGVLADVPPPARRELTGVGQ